MRIFTGGVVPEGANAIIIQEDADADGRRVTFREAATAGQHVRAAGLDFKAGEALAKAGHRLTARDLSLIAAGDVAEVVVRRRPRVVFVATGDELSVPGAPRKPGGIVASSGYALAAMIERWGGDTIDLGILPDTAEAVAGIADKATGADLIVTLGGASVGDHDLVQKALGPRGFALDFWKIAMRPGKPLIFGKLGRHAAAGIARQSGVIAGLCPALPAPGDRGDAGCGRATPVVPAKLLARGVKENDGRQDYLRARVEVTNGERIATAVSDSGFCRC